MRRRGVVTFCFAAALSALAVSAPAQQQRRTSTFHLVEWNHGKFIYGGDYYPEAWAESQWEKDAEMMQAAGINLVRLGEFSWVKMEPAEGQFDFCWLDHALKILSAHGIHAPRSVQILDLLVNAAHRTTLLVGDAACHDALQRDILR